MILQTKKIFPLLISIALISSACGTSSQTDTDIGTAVALTVEAQNSLTKVAVLTTLTPVPTLEPQSTPEIQPTNTPNVALDPGCTLSAVMVGENPPDDTMLLPGQEFWKTWTLQNTGTCTWDKSYSLVFWDGDLMGGLTSYPLPDVFAPNETKDISIYLKAPESDGIATGYWSLQAPWGTNFGVGPQSVPFYVKIATSANPEYGVSSVTYNVVRDPLEGCQLNVKYTVYATVTSSGPVKINYYWDQSDGNENGVRPYEFTEAGSKTFKREWMISMNDNPVQRWVKFIVTSPEYIDNGGVVIDHKCYNQ